MKTPPFLLFAALLFWGWQSDLLLIGAIMGVALEGSRFTRFRWELDDPDFSRIWFFCLVLILALIGYVFTRNDGGGGLNGLIHGNLAQNAANSSVQTTTRFLRWLPMTTFALILAQVFNLRQTIPLTAISIVLRWRERKGDRAFAGKYVDIAYPYFIICIFSAGIHANSGTQTYFLGQCVLIAWALWSIRSRRFSTLIWLRRVCDGDRPGRSGKFRRQPGTARHPEFQRPMVGGIFHPADRRAAKHDQHGPDRTLKLSAKIVVWLEPHELGEVPEYLREASYRNYQATKQTWYGGGTLNDFVPLHSEPDNTSLGFAAGQNEHLHDQHRLLSQRLVA